MIKKSKNSLYEGMRAGDLTNLVLPLISVDEYESNISKEAVAIGFYVHDQEAANDLNRFLQKSPVSILSSEVSPAPDQHGYYIVFIEMMANNRISSNLEFILMEMEPLCDIKKWKIRVRKTEELVTFTKENFDKLLHKARQSDDKTLKESIILDFFDTSELDFASVFNNRLTMKRGNHSIVCEVKDFGLKNILINGMKRNPEQLEMKSVLECNRIASMLGDGWSVKKIDDKFVVDYCHSAHSLLIDDCEIM